MSGLLFGVAPFDVATILGPDISRLRQDKSLIEQSTVGNYTANMLGFNERPGHITTDVKVRQALITAIDPKAYAHPLEALGLPVVCRDAARTTEFTFHYEGDRRLMTVDAVGDPWSPDDVDGWAGSTLAGVGWVQVAGLLRTDFPAPTIAALARGGRRLLLDAQGVVRLGKTGPLAGVRPWRCSASTHSAAV